MALRTKSQKKADQRKRKLEKEKAEAVKRRSQPQGSQSATWAQERRRAAGCMVAATKAMGKAKVKRAITPPATMVTVAKATMIHLPCLTLTHDRQNGKRTHGINGQTRNLRHWIWP